MGAAYHRRASAMHQVPQELPLCERTAGAKKRGRGDPFTIPFPLAWLAPGPTKLCFRLFGAVMPHLEGGDFDIWG